MAMEMPSFSRWEHTTDEEAQRCKLWITEKLQQIGRAHV